MKHKKQGGFTIIEVLIVLAIAGLIIMIVFLAVPAVMRNSRNNRRKYDLAKFFSAVQEFSMLQGTKGSAPFVSGTGGGATVNTAQFNDFKNNFLGPEFAFYENSVIAKSPFDDHQYEPIVDQIVYFPWHYCIEEEDGNLVNGNSHESYNFAITIGMENNFYICLDNGTDLSQWDP